MTTTQAPTILHPAQFTVARTLASAYSHLWAGVPDDTYNMEDIHNWSAERQHPMLPGGIFSPDLEWDAQFEHYDVTHVTGSGRLAWRIMPNGNTMLQIFRPADLSPMRAHAARTFAYAAISSVEPPDESGILVAQVWLINDNDDVFEFEDDIQLSVSSKEREQAINDNESFPTSAAHSPELRDDVLFERHVYALIRPIVALLTVKEEAEYQRRYNELYEANAEYTEIEKLNEERQAQIIRPTIEKVRTWLQPLFEIALPDPAYDVYKDNQLQPKPATYWTRQEEHYWREREPMMVYHYGESFPVESEKTAVHAVLLLRQQPEMALLDAIKAAIRSSDYRPEEEEN